MLFVESLVKIPERRGKFWQTTSESRQSRNAGIEHENRDVIQHRQLSVGTRVFAVRA
jgi:hypothetical protein